MRLTKNFSFDEMKCPCCGKCNMDVKFMYKLQYMRDDYGKAMNISSGYRCKEYNDNILLGSPNSRHKEGIAVDVAVRDPHEKYMLVKKAVEHGFSNLGVYDGHVHIDDREGPQRMWAGKSK